ncbi:hypothetical protein Btru_067680 [Bulinus truncatus]|nr:hypothetical protein Btru_067680 [Bulinus truncatus]
MTDYLGNTYTAQPISSSRHVSLISKRTTVYKAGLVVSLLSFVLFFLGDGGIHSLISISTLAKVFSIVCLISYVITIGVAVFENTRKVNPNTYHSRKLEICLIKTGVFCTITIVFFRATELFPSVWFHWPVVFAFVSLLFLYTGFLLILCGNKKVFSQPMIHSVQFAPGPTQNVQITQGMPVMFSHQYTVQTQPLLATCSVPPGAPPPYSLPPSYPAPYLNQTMPSYSYLPPASQFSTPSAPPDNSQGYSHNYYGRPQSNVMDVNRVHPSAPQCEENS